MTITHVANTPIEDLDLVVVGGGKAGKTLAMDWARAGQTAAMIERSKIGGTCINVACIPTKTLINSGRVLNSARRATEFGITGVEKPRMSVDLLRLRKEDVVNTMVAGQLASFTDSGMDFILGEARFVGDRTVEVALNNGGSRALRGADVVLNLGTKPLPSAIEGMAESSVQTSDTLLALGSLPESIIVLGGGYIGCEFADLLNTIGVQVTIVQGGSQLLPREDPDIAAAIEKMFTNAGITVLLGARAAKIARDTDGTVTVTLPDGGSVTADDILVAVGRKPVTDGMNLEGFGIELSTCRAGPNREVLYGRRREPVVSRMIRRAGNKTGSAGHGRWPWAFLNRWLTAAEPRLTTGEAIVVSRGSRRAASKMLSKPMTWTSSGTCWPALRMALMKPMAIKSL